MQYDISHNIYFKAERDDTWPESLPWPEWKPETDKAYRPTTLRFTIGWTHEARAPYVPTSVNVDGFRILKNGNTGTDVSCSYYGDGLNKLPKPFHDLLHAALLVAHTEKDHYERQSPRYCPCGGEYGDDGVCPRSKCQGYGEG